MFFHTIPLQGIPLLSLGWNHIATLSVALGLYVFRRLSFPSQQQNSLHSSTQNSHCKDVSGDFVENCRCFYLFSPTFARRPLPRGVARNFVFFGENGEKEALFSLQINVFPTNCTDNVPIFLDVTRGRCSDARPRGRGQGC